MQIGYGDSAKISADGRTITFQAPAGREGALALPRLGTEDVGRQTTAITTVPIKAQAANALPTLLEGPLGAAGIAGVVAVTIAVKHLRRIAGDARCSPEIAGDAAWTFGEEAESRAVFEARYGSGRK